VTPEERIEALNMLGLGLRKAQRICAEYEDPELEELSERLYDMRGILSEVFKDLDGPAIMKEYMQ